MDEKTNSLDNAQRNYLIDIMKGIGIICMVMGHAGAPFTHFIYLFHMPLFFMISGYLFKGYYAFSPQEICYFIKRKIKSIYIPYICSASVYTLLHNLFIKINIYTDNYLLLEYVPKGHANITEYWEDKDFVRELLKNMLLGTSSEMGGALWFVANLFEISILFCCMEFIGKKYLRRNNGLIFQGVISAFLLMLGYYCSIHNISFFVSIQRLFSCYSLFYLGYLVNKLITARTFKNITRNIIGCIIGLCTLLILNSIGHIELVYNEYVDPVYLLLCALFGGLFIYSMAVIFSNFKYVSSILCMAGKSTFSILTLHFLCFKIINYIGVFCEGKPLYLVAAFPILYTEKYAWLIYTAVGLAVPILCKLVKDTALKGLFSLWRCRN